MPPNLPETGVRLVAENERGFISSLNNATGAVDSFQKDTGRASVGVIALGTALGNLVSGGLSFIASTAIKAGSALAGMVTSGVQQAAALESQMSAIGAVTGATAEEMEALENLIIDLGLDPNLTVSTTEAADAIEMLGKNGVSVTDILDGMALSTVQLANSTGADFGTAADLATDVMAVFGREGLEMQDAVNGITAVVNSSKFDINDFALSLANGGSVAAATGVEFDDFTTAIAATAFNFSSGQTAGTAFRNLLTRLTPSTEKAADEMANLGLITADGQNVFFDAEGSLKDMNDISQLLSESLSGLSEAQKSATLETIFGADASAAAIALAQVGAPIYGTVSEAMEGLGLSFEEATEFMEAGGTEFARVSQQMDKVNAADSAATRVDNFAGAMDILGGIVESVKIQIGNKFLPVLTDLAKNFSEFIDENSQPFIDFFSSAADFLSVFFQGMLNGSGIMDSFNAALAEVVPPDTHAKIMLITDSIGGFIEKVVSFVTEHKDTFIGALAGIGAVIAGAGLVASIAGIGAAIASLFTPIGLIIAGAGLLGAAWANNWGGIQEKTTAVINFIKPFITDSMEFIKTFWAENGDTILAKATEIWEGVKTAINTVFLFIRDNIVIPISTTIAEFWSKNGETIKKNTETVWNFIKLFMDTSFKNLKVLFEAFSAAFSGDWKGFGSKLREIWDNALLFLLTAWEGFGKNALLKISTFITDTVAKFGETDWAEIGKNIIQGIIDGISSMGTLFSDAVQSVAEAGADAARGFLGIESPSKLFEGYGKNIGEGLAIGIGSEGSTVATAASGLSATAAAAIATPASAGQILNRSVTNNSSRTVNFSGNFASQPTITDRDALIEAMAMS